jgi:hypothetical protein
MLSGAKYPQCRPATLIVGEWGGERSSTLLHQRSLDWYAAAAVFEGHDAALKPESEHEGATSAASRSLLVAYQFLNPAEVRILSE